MNKRSFENITQRNPIQKFQQRSQSSFDQRGVLRIVLKNKKKKHLNIFKFRKIKKKTSNNTITNWHNWNTAWNSPQNCCFRWWAFAWVIWPDEKSKTSSLKWSTNVQIKKNFNVFLILYLNSFKIIILFWHNDSFARLAPTISEIKSGQFLGHSLLTIFKTKEIILIIIFKIHFLKTFYLN